MDQVYLPGKIRDRIQDLMKSRKVTQAELAAKIGCSESALSRFISGKTDKLGDESIIRIARAFEVSTDFLLGEVDEPDRKNYDISELGLSVEAARNLYTQKVNPKIVSYLLENPQFADALPPEEAFIKAETLWELYAALDKLKPREQTYLLYRFGFTDDIEHTLIGAAIHFHLSENRTKLLENRSLDTLRRGMP